MGVDEVFGGMRETGTENVKLFSVIVPCHNSVSYLEACYQSIVGQTIGMEKLEVIFVDDASDDETFEMLCGMEKEYPDSIAVIQLNHNLRQGGARNIALQYAGGEYISFVDSDDRIRPDMYEKLSGIVETYHPDIIKFSHDVVTDFGMVLREERQDGEGYYTVGDDEERRRLLMSETLDYGCWNKVYRLDMLQNAAVSFAEYLIYEEPKFTYPLYFYIKDFYLMDEVFYHYTFNVKGTMQTEMRKTGKLYDHAEVQMQTFEFVENTLPEGIMDRFSQEIEAYFIKSCLCETIIFAGRSGVPLEKSVVEYLKKWIGKKFPKYKDNIYVSDYFSDEHKEALKIMDMELTQEQLNGFCQLIGKNRL